MTEKEWGIVLATLKSAYGVQKLPNDTYSVKVWFTLLKDIPYDVAAQVAAEHISVSVFPPTIAEFRRKAVRIVTGEQMYWEDAWKLVRKAIGKFGRLRPVEGINSLPEDVRPIVEAIGWTKLCLSEDETSDRANFRDIYNRRFAQAQEDKALPEAVRQNNHRLYITYEEVKQRSIAKDAEQTN